MSEAALRAELAEIEAELRELAAKEQTAARQRMSAALETRRQEIEQILAGSPAGQSPEQAAGFDQHEQAVHRPQTNIAGGASGTVFSGSFKGPVNIPQFTVEAGGQVFVFYGHEKPAALAANDPQALRSYLDYLIAEHQHLKLQGIRSGSQALSVALERVYISLGMTEALDGHLPDPSGRKEHRRIEGEPSAETGGPFSLAAALQRRRRLVIIGDPGSGKTTLLAYLALTYARALRDGADLVAERLGLGEAGHLPIFLPLRNLGAHIRNLPPALDGPKLLLDYLDEYYRMQDVCLPADFFKAALESGQAALLLDGLDEVAEPALRGRIAWLIEQFTRKYSQARIIATSRVAGYEGIARVGESFGLGRVRDLNQAEVRRFVHDWQVVVEVTLANSDAPAIVHKAQKQAENLIGAIESSERVSELAVNPLLLTVIALVHRYRARLPERRADLYEEAVEVLLGSWDAGKGLDGGVVLPDERRLDPGDLRSLLEPVAFWMHELELKEIQRPHLEALLRPRFQALLPGGAAAAQPPDPAGKLLEAYLKQTAERNGLFVERGPGIFGFSHLTFQEYLAARALANRADHLAYTIKVLPAAWWREVILLQAGYLSNQGPRRVSELLEAMMEAPMQGEPEPLHVLRLAAECLQNVGEARLEPGLPDTLRSRLQTYADLPLEKGNKPNILRKIHATNTLARLGRGQPAPHFWKLPYGEPVWIEIPAGEFIMGTRKEEIPALRRKYGGDEEFYLRQTPQHRLDLPAYAMAITPVTNAQYDLYVQDTGAKPPGDWRGGRPPKGLEDHPVVNISWHAAMAYCRWLSAKTGRDITLPSEAEWEKAARGVDGREFPWGDKWHELHCNSYELGLGETTPVGVFPNGASPYNVLDLSGNVLEWTRNSYGSYPYDPKDGREDLAGEDVRVLRGGAFRFVWLVRCAFRLRLNPNFILDFFGFRVVLLLPLKA